ncbi:Lipid carrier : UDP-N-acetylgalactosaminyltransferase / Alpha-1,3-N-acetylgalactosamine transferase PglA; Putative glycosyltransferase [hydrothermal vent metagenome]|uniref:Lipid carrier: UDP-N-acetylgalactosaminyltransferase / Alpha-1,3-N-acetylgalactosamine transferase PglA Putative glycosyltransferase n=1 Tax=hydrothermal vent metagenome TaxID=652676 RepID=A0A3B0YB36_9ZZZZ
MIFLLIASFPDSLIKFREPLIDALLAQGFTVHIAVPDLDIDSSIYSLLVKKGVKIHDVPLSRTGLNPLKDLFLLFTLCRLMLAIRPQFVLGYTIKPVIYGSLAAYMISVPYRFALITGLGYAFTGELHGVRKLLSIIVRQLYRLSLQGVHKVFFQNPDDQLLFRQLKILNQYDESFVVNGSGIDVSAFTNSDLPKRTSFLLIARLLGDKGVREYAAAAKFVRQKYSNVCFRLVGWIDSNPDAIEQHELDRWVNDGTFEYLGKMDDVRPAISDCSVYVLPSYREGTPRTVLEAMAMGRAVITTDAPGCRETVVDGDNGFLVPVKSVVELAEAMIKFIEDDTLALRMGKRSREIAAEKYDVHKVNKVMLREMCIQ